MDEYWAAIRTIGTKLIHRVVGSRLPTHAIGTSGTLSHWKIAIQLL